MKKLVFIIILSVSGMTFAQDLMWGLTVDAARNKQEDYYNEYYYGYDSYDYKNDTYFGIGGHINYRIFRQLYIKSGIMIHRNKDGERTYTSVWNNGNDYSIYTNTRKGNQFFISIPVQVSLKVWKGLSVYSGISLSKYNSTITSTYDNDSIIQINKFSGFTINPTLVGLQYAFKNGISIGGNLQVLSNFNSYHTLRLSYDIGQYEWQ